MRLVAAALALALWLAAPAAAQPAGTPPLAANEVLLEINSVGTATKRADLATYRISIELDGEGADDARRVMAERIRRLTAAAASAGVAAGDVEPGPVRVETHAAMDINERAMADALATVRDPAAESAETAADAVRRAADAAVDAAEAAMPMAEEPPPPLARPGATASSSIVIRLRDMGRIEALHNALAEVEGGHSFYAGGPVYTLNDPRPPRTEARMRALAAARADADDYAAALGMRVARLVRVTDRVGVDLLGLMMSEGGRRAVTGASDTSGPDVVTVVPIGVDFVLAPR